MLKVIRVIALTVSALVVLLLSLPWLYVAGFLVAKTFTERTAWRIEDYMCTLPEGCDEFIAERRRQREQELARPTSSD
ncbi:hypothetical protein J6500_26190 [Bradyrhizobium sp. WSM 1704]|uniref:hypothetical protein n=1 Tax=Bradyrhizobium semiaridum TaxID=2821404 RepID=UPI001CE288A1|nr:hypothetical protein [Bradyrhizobium semiaridum]MCA6125358.1 hypothetical protein [Bradyrhizobium semiaridum]